MENEKKKYLEQWLLELEQQRKPLLDQKNDLEDRLESLRFRSNLSTMLQNQLDFELESTYEEMFINQISDELEIVRKKRREFEKENSEKITILNFMIDSIQAKISDIK